MTRPPLSLAPINSLTKTKPVALTDCAQLFLSHFTPSSHLSQRRSIGVSLQSHRYQEVRVKSDQKRRIAPRPFRSHGSIRDEAQRGREADVTGWRLRRRLIRSTHRSELFNSSYLHEGKTADSSMRSRVGRASAGQRPCSSVCVSGSA